MSQCSKVGLQSPCFGGVNFILTSCLPSRLKAKPGLGRTDIEIDETLHCTDQRDGGPMPAAQYEVLERGRISGQDVGYMHVCLR